MDQAVPASGAANAAAEPVSAAQAARHRTGGESGTGELRRLHPATPVLRGWKLLAVLVAFVGQNAVRDVTPRVLAVQAGIALVVACVLGALSWWFTKYQIDGDELRIERGIWFRRIRHVRIDRLQAVDVVRPVLARFFGLAELRIEVAGSGETEAPLAFLTDTAARELRAELLARAAGLDAATPEAPEQHLVSVPPETLFASTVVSAPFLVSVGGFAAVSIGALVAGELLAVALLVPWALAATSVVWSQFIAEFGFTVSESADGLRIRKGMLDTWAQTVPPGRVQGVKIEQQLLWRPKRWVKLSVDVAGYGGAPGQGRTSSLLLPVAPWPVAVALLGRVLPDVDLDAVARRAAPRRARWLRPIGWRHLRHGLADQVLVTDEGWLTRRTHVVPYGKTQSVRLRQGPVQRLLRLGTVCVDTPAGPVRAVARHRDAAQARALADEQARRARAARLTAGPDRWMTDS